MDRRPRVSVVVLWDISLVIALRSGPGTDPILKAPIGHGREAVHPRVMAVMAVSETDRTMVSVRLAGRVTAHDLSQGLLRESVPRLRVKPPLGMPPVGTESASFPVRNIKSAAPRANASFAKAVIIHSANALYTKICPHDGMAANAPWAPTT